jgi:hypothetical protein
MTKAKARARAKAKAAEKAKKRATGGDQAAPKAHPGKFDPGAGTIKGPHTNANTRVGGAVRRGAARSR